VPPWEPSPTKSKYVQLADHLAARIAAGEWQPGSRLPPERELAAEYEVGYNTLRNAIAVLRDRGAVVTRHGGEGGTYVVDD
jgi:DNA-binding GntR family transcriptional regulator